MDIKIHSVFSAGFGQHMCLRQFHQTYYLADDKAAI